MKHTNTRNEVMRTVENKTVVNYSKAKKLLWDLRKLQLKDTRNILNLMMDGVTRTQTDIYCKLRMEQSVASTHLKFLINMGIIEVVKNGLYKDYSVNFERIQEINSFTSRIK